MIIKKSLKDFIQSLINESFQKLLLLYVIQSKREIFEHVKTITEIIWQLQQGL